MQQHNNITIMSFQDFLAEARTILQHTGSDYKNPRGISVDTVHQHPDIAPQKLSAADIQAIRNYSSSSRESFKDFTPTPGHNSRAMNSYLKDLAAGKVKSEYEGQNVKHIKQGVANLKAVFTPENTNKSNIIVYSGIPSYVGKMLKDKGTMRTHQLDAFTSLTTSRRKAEDFAEMHNDEHGDDLDEPRHILKMVAHVGTVVSAAHNSYASDSENELIAHPNSVIMYHGSTLDTTYNTMVHSASLTGHL